MARTAERLLTVENVLVHRHSQVAGVSRQRQWCQTLWFMMPSASGPTPLLPPWEAAQPS